MSFYTDTIMTDPRFHSTECIRDLALLEPATRAAVEAIIADAANEYAIVLEVTETFRSQERQAQLFAEHATQLQHVGVHNFGCAADFCKILDEKASWAGDWTFLRDLAVKHGLVSGVDWGQPNQPHSFCDSDHVQRCSMEDQPKLLAQEWYPDSSYSPYPTQPATTEIPA